jgi:hypothetical protein
MFVGKPHWTITDKKKGLNMEIILCGCVEVRIELAHKCSMAGFWIP